MAKIVFLGVEGTGKTVLTNALALRFKAHESDGWYLKPASRDSFRFIEQLPDQVGVRSWPHETTQCRRLEWHVTYQRKNVHAVSILDYPGEVYRYSFLDEADAEDPELFREKCESYKKEIRTLLKHLMEAETVFVLFNLTDAEDLGGNAKNLDAVWVTHACLDYVEKLPSSPKIVFVLTQIDRHVRNLQAQKKPIDIEAVVRDKIPLIWQNHPDLDVMAVSSLVDGDSPYGVDRLIERWFSDAPFIQQQVEDFRAVAVKIPKVVSAFCEHPARGTTRIVETFAAYEKVQSDMSWFLDRRHCLDTGLFVDSDEYKSVQTIVQEMGEVPGEDFDAEIISKFCARLKIVDCCGLNGFARRIAEAAHKWACECSLKLKDKYERTRRRRRWSLSLLFVGAVLLLLFGAKVGADAWNMKSRHAHSGKVGAEKMQREKENELREKRGHVWRALVCGREVRAVLETSVFKYPIPRRKFGLERNEIIPGGKITAVVNGSIYSSCVTDKVVDWEGVYVSSCNLQFKRRANPSDGESSWVEGLPHPTAMHWIAYKDEGMWVPEKGYRQKDPNTSGLGELVKKD